MIQAQSYLENGAIYLLAIFCFFAFSDVGLVYGSNIVNGIDYYATKYITSKACTVSVSREQYSKDIGEIKDTVKAMKYMLELSTADTINIKSALEKAKIHIKTIVTPEDIDKMSQMGDNNE